MDPSTFTLVLFAAICHASWNALAKDTKDPWLRMAFGQAMSGIICFLLLFFVPIPSPNSWVFLIGSIFAHQLYYVGVSYGYKLGDLSQVYPIQRGISPVLISSGAYIFAGEEINQQGLLGVLIISLSILALSVTKHKTQKSHKPLYCALFTGLMITFYTIFDAFGGRNSGNVFGYIVWLNFLDAIPFPLSVFWYKRHVIKRKSKQELKSGLIIGVLGTSAYASVIWALSFAPMAYVSALRETSVVIAVWIGSRVLKESFGAQRMVAAIFTVLGIFLLQSS